MDGSPAALSIEGHRPVEGEGRSVVCLNALNQAVHSDHVGSGHFKRTENGRRLQANGEIFRGETACCRYGR